MRILFILTCCFALVSPIGAAQVDDQNNPNPKKKGQAVFQPQQRVNPKAYNAHPYTNPKLQANPNLSGVSPSNANPYRTNLNSSKSNAFKAGTAAPTFNKTTTFNKNVTINKNFKIQHFNLGNQPSGKYHAVQFNQNYKIAGAHNWNGPKYQVFVNYHPQWHDQGWWSSHHNHIVFVFGSPYYWDAGYYYPAWGYNPGANYYYDGPIYTGSEEMDPGQAVANVQSALQQQGFYQGEIDGVLGPQTRAALAEYQQSQGLEPTGAMDEPTLESLGMAS